MLIVLFIGIRAEVSRAYVIQKNSLWPTSKALIIHVLDGDEQSRLLIKDMYGQWLNRTQLKFKVILGVPKENEVSHIRILIQTISNTSLVGAEALLKSNLEPTMHLSVLSYDWVSKTDQDRIVLHEVGHSLGMLHEHKNPEFNYKWDNDAVESYCIKKNTMTKKICIANFTRAYDLSLVEYSEFDEDSIMRYKIKPELIQSNVLNSYIYTLSRLDIMAMELYY